MAGIAGYSPLALSDLLREEDIDVPDVQDLIQSLLLGRGQQYAPPSPPDQGNEWRDEPYQVAGDVVPLRPGMDPAYERFLSRMNQEPLSGQMGWRSMGALAPGSTPRDPKLDLMDILMFNRRPK